ncbi:ParB/RepB/Spo0J family partition protein [Cochlodiniinecator piscidefendens]|uniref:ParB/RepB/Spo0J family partition protein n=1 Tax=Cochlodiniinecator piscidefendens TaxID=2715756 RepID=UPI00140BC1DD|nr:ParB N-terminal domain-containing protein [Cochlodiniinecator piscidefendens]
MARKRLTPAQAVYLDASSETEPNLGELDSNVRTPPPISEVAGMASATAALEEVTETLRVARETGRLIEPLSLDVVDDGYLVRDRIITDEDDMAALVESIRSRGQQTPIEVERLDNGRYGLISGWRRLTALRNLFAETGDERFAQVLAVLRQPDGAADAYLAMVEENEIRVGLSFYERARIAAKSVEQGVYPTEKAALLDLFRAASRAKRSKIRSFLPIVAQLDQHLQFPAALGERLGLLLSKTLQEYPESLNLIAERLGQRTYADAATEQADISQIISEVEEQKQTLKPNIEPTLKGIPKVSVKVRKDGGVIVSGLTDAQRESLLGWLQDTF